MSGPRVTLIVAVSENGVIGRDLDMPWKLSTDLKRFKAMTMGKPLIMGRKTFLSVGERPLPGRPHIIISRNADYRPDGVDVVSSLDEAFKLAKTKAAELGVDEVFVAGGGEIYRQAMPFADQLSVTHVAVKLDGDTFSRKSIPPSLKKSRKVPFWQGKRTIIQFCSPLMCEEPRQSELFTAIGYLVTTSALKRTLLLPITGRYSRRTRAIAFERNRERLL